MALAYKRTLSLIESVANVEVEVIHIVGGGSANGLLNQLTADATGLEVIAGPVEATVFGNVAMQALLDGSISSLQEARNAIARSAQTTHYFPAREIDWDALSHRLAY